MGEVKRTSLKAEFFAAVAVTLLAVALASAATIYGCWRLQKWLVPDTNYVMVNMGYQTPDGVEKLESTRVEVDGGESRLLYIETEDGVPSSRVYDAHDIVLSVESVDYGIGRNGPRRRLAYIGAGIAMGVLPAAYSIIGVLLCAWWFYRKKLAPAITVLDGAARHITEQDLDFSVSCPLTNELGRLCASFEEMRRTLAENNRRLWKLLEERRLVQASIAHDLRNPIAIIQGYAEYLQIHLKKGNLSAERIGGIADNMDRAAKRLGQYTESVRAINQLEEIDIRRERVDAAALAEGIRNDFTLMAAGQGIALRVEGPVPRGEMEADAAVLYRALENILNNALRYAKTTVTIAFEKNERTFSVTVADDGPGFPTEVLQNRQRLLMSPADGDGRRGLGLTISRLLCRKHGGRLELSNRPEGGAAVKIVIGI